MGKDTRTGGRDATTAVIPGSFGLSVGQPSTSPPSGFAWRALSDLARLESGHTPSRSKPEYWDGDIPWIGIRDASGNHGRVLLDTVQHVSQLGLDNSSARLLPVGTVCLSRTASVGFVVTMGRPMATSQDFVNWVCGPELDHRYLHYLLMAEQDTVRRIAYGSVHPTMYYPDAKALHICVPDLTRQQAIVDVLLALDLKIDANDQVLKSLADLEEPAYRRVEATATGMVPLRELAQISKGHSYRRSDLDASDRALVTLKSIGRDGQFAFRGFKEFIGEPRPDQVVHPGEIVVAQTDLTQAADVIGWAVRIPEVAEYKELVASLDLVVVRAAGSVPNPYLLGALRTGRFREHCRARMSGTTVLHLGRGAVDSFEVPVASDALVAEYCDGARARAQLADALNAESRQLASTRDELLPLLMSGKVRVTDAEKSVEGVL